MQIDLDGRSVRMSVGDFADFTLGPRDGGEGPAGIWRAQLGTHWHRQLQTSALAAFAGAQFEVPVEGRLAAGRWTIHLGGRIDQSVRVTDGSRLLREIKTVSRPLPEGEDVLRRDYPGYFVQLAAYGAMQPEPIACELVFVEVASGLTQIVPLAPDDHKLLTAQLARVQEFLELRLRARDRLRHLQFGSPFPALRPGQETVAQELAAATMLGERAVVLDAPTGFGKTGVLLEFALGRLRTGEFERVIYLTGKATGQLQVARTLAAMGPPPGAGGPAVWVVRPKVEHCVNQEFHCVREACRFLSDVESRWNGSGLARFYLRDDQARDLASLRAAGLDARICPYEITRSALAFNDVWVGDYNYVFAPGSRGLFFHQPGFEPGRTLLLIDEAHNLPGRVADAYSHRLSAAEAHAAGIELLSVHPMAPLTRAWREWSEVLHAISPAPELSPGAEADARTMINQLAELIGESGVDYGALSPRSTEVIWHVTSLADDLDTHACPRLWWCRRAGELSLTCLDASAMIGAALREFGGVILASATPGPSADFAAACGLAPAAGAAVRSPPPARLEAKLGDLSKRQTRALARAVSSGADLLRQVEAAAEPVARVVAHAPWRDHAYDVALDLRVDTTFQHRAQHARTTALTVEALAEAHAPAAAFFPSYAYAELIAAELSALAPGLSLGLQPKGLDLAAQTAWMEQALDESDLLFLVLGSSFSEGIDVLGGRVSHALVAGPALPEVNPVQRARLAALSSLGRETAVRRTYQIPGMQKVNQALGRLVRAPGQRARVVLHCRRFQDPAFSELLSEPYRHGTPVDTDEAFSAWLTKPSVST